MRTKTVRILGLVMILIMTLLGISARAQHFEFDANRAAELRQINLNAKLNAQVGSKNLRFLKIAIFENGFGGYAEGDSTLPKNTKLIANPALALGIKEVQGNALPLALSDHGLAMAQTVWAMTGLNRKNAPQFFLVNVNGWTNFKYAVDWAVANKVDIVLNARNFEIGNMNGSGFINKKVNEAVKSGILWINAAGNYGESVYSGPLKVTKKGRVLFSYTNQLDRDSLRFIVEKDSTPLVLTLNWDDLKNSESEATKIDLDLALVDARGKTVTTTKVLKDGTKTTVPVIVNYRSDGRGEKSSDSADTRAYSTLPYEQVEMTLNRGEYRIQVKSRSKITQRSRLIRVMVLSQRSFDPKSENRGIDFIDRTMGDEIFTPADNPNVITVADRSPISSRGPLNNKTVKPDILVADSRIELTDGRDNLFGTSTSAAIFAGALALMIVDNPDLDQKELRDFIDALRREQNNVDVPTIANPEMPVASE